MHRTGALAAWVGAVALLCLLTALPPAQGKGEWNGACNLIRCVYDWQCAEHHDRGCGYCGGNGTCTANTTICGRNCSYDFECGGACSNCTMGQCSPDHCGQRCNATLNRSSCTAEGCTICNGDSRCVSPVAVCNSYCRTSRDCRDSTGNASSSRCPNCVGNRCEQSSCGARCFGHRDCGGECSRCEQSRCRPRAVPVPAPIAPAPSSNCGQPCNPFKGGNCVGECGSCMKRAVGVFICLNGGKKCGRNCRSSSDCGGQCDSCTTVGGGHSECLGRNNTNSSTSCGHRCYDDNQCAWGDHSRNSSCPFCNLNLNRCTASACGRNCSTHRDCLGRPGGCPYCDFGRCSDALDEPLREPTPTTTSWFSLKLQVVGDWVNWAFTF